MRHTLSCISAVAMTFAAAAPAQAQLGLLKRAAGAVARPAATAATRPSAAADTTAARDTTHLADSTAKAIASAPAPRRGGLLGKALSGATGAAAAIQHKTGVSVPQAAQGALAVAGKTNPGVFMLQDVIRMEQRDQARAAVSQAARERQAAAGMAMAQSQMQAGMGAAVAQLAATQQPGIAATGNDPVLAAARTEYMQLAARAAAGDRSAADQLARFQREMVAVAPSINAMPATAQEAAYGTALRAALTCATHGQGCRTH